jgi:predicted GTPase
VNQPRKRKSTSKPAHALHMTLLAAALLIPAASLIPFGGLWLWQHGLVIYWALASCAIVASAFLLLRRLLARAAPARGGQPDERVEAAGEASWTPRQDEAWQDVLALASTVEPQRLSSRDAAQGLALETVELVARRLHPERSEPLLQFTVPEALAVIERASKGMRSFVVRTFPLGDRITVAQLMWLYRWRGALQLAEKGFDLWRIVRLLNPLSAATQEVRERLTRQVFDMGRQHVAQRLAAAFVREIGRAAIDLYGGNLRVTGEELSAHVTATSRSDLAAVEAREAEPLRILVAGQTGAGKSSLVNALANAVEAQVDALPATQNFTAYKLTHEGLPAALLVDSPGVAGGKGVDALIRTAANVDMVLWVSSAGRAARELDRQALAAIREHFAGEPNRRRPPMLLVLTHIDALRPFNEWDPPYDLTQASRPKSQAILGAMQAAGEELGFAPADIVPVRADGAAAPYNVDALWARIMELVPDAQRARLLRTLSDARNAQAWSRLWSQAATAGRVLKDTFIKRNPAQTGSDPSRRSSS